MSRKANHKKLKPWQRMEIMAMYEWMEQNDPDFQESAATVQQPLKPRFVVRNGHRKKMPRSNRQHY